jgi:hypothetical protein
MLWPLASSMVLVGCLLDTIFVRLRPTRRNIKLIECNAKCRYLKSKTLTCKGTLRQVFYLSEAPYPPVTPYPTVYSILIHTGKWEGGELTREKVRGEMFHKAGRKYQHD